MRKSASLVPFQRIRTLLFAAERNRAKLQAMLDEASKTTWADAR